MERTEFAGLTRLDPGESLAEDGFSFQARNPDIIDRLLRYAILFQRRDAHPALAHAVPALDPAVTALDEGGTIPAETEIFVGYTLIDQYLGETTLNANLGSVTTRASLGLSAAPTLTVDHVAGTLLAADYSYAVTVTDGIGGESALGEQAVVTVPYGSAMTEIVVSGLAALLAATGGTGWRLWRQVNGGTWNLIATGVSDVVLDDGTLPIDCNVQPPLDTTSTSNATNRLQVTVPADQPVGAVRFRIYASVGDNSFPNPSMLGEYPIADAGAAKVFTELSFQSFAPPVVSNTMPGAPLIDAASEIAGLTVGHLIRDDGAALPTQPDLDFQGAGVSVTDDEVGGRTVVTIPGGAGGGGVIPRDEGVDLPVRSRLNFTGAGVTATDDATNDQTLVDVPGGGGGGGGGVAQFQPDSIVSVYPISVSRTPGQGMPSSGSSMYSRVLIPRTGTLHDLCVGVIGTANPVPTLIGAIYRASDGALLWRGVGVVATGFGWNVLGDPALAVAAGDDLFFCLCDTNSGMYTFLAQDLSFTGLSRLPASFLPSTPRITARRFEASPPDTLDAAGMTDTNKIFQFIARIV